MIEAFNPVSWGEEDVTAGKLNAMASNEQWLYENLPRVHLQTYGGIRKDTKCKIAAGDSDDSQEQGKDSIHPGAL